MGAHVTPARAIAGGESRRRRRDVGLLGGGVQGGRRAHVRRLAFIGLKVTLFLLGLGHGYARFMLRTQLRDRR